MFLSLLMHMNTWDFWLTGKGVGGGDDNMRGMAVSYKLKIS
jgi:hypothetical protein